MDYMILGLSRKSSYVEKLLEELLTTDVPIQNVSVMMREDADVAKDYFQKMDVINDVVGSKIGISAITIEDLGEVVIGGPLAARLGVSTADESYNPDDDIIGLLAGGLVNALMDIGIGEEDAEFISDELKKKAILVGVMVSEKQISDIQALFEKHAMDRVLEIGA